MNVKNKKKVILILSSNSDQSTSDVIEYLLSMNENIIRLNYEDGIEIKTTSLNKNVSDVVFISKKKEIKISSIKSFWYRKGELLSNNKELDCFSGNINWYLNEEQKATFVYLTYLLDKKSKINYINDGDINKLIQLDVALKCKLNIPDTLLTKNRKSCQDFIEKHNNVITKSIQAPFGHSDNKKSYSLMTNIFALSDLEKSPKTFFITKFQKQIKKIFELRIFYLAGSFYSMAIFSQNDDKTTVDFRNYNYERPNRRVPYSLPINIEAKLKKLMKLLNLNSGSIDMIVDVNHEFYFLEVNPVGQFGMVSYPCNYNLEEKIANILSKKNG
jgi:ATP-GRASP peptide maturase of grasp-with-spasm system